MEFKTVTSQSAELERINEIFIEAFPPSERSMSVENMVLFSEKNDFFTVASAFDGDLLAGFFVTAQVDNCVVILYMAVNSEIRGGGYGTKILTALLDHYKDKVVLGVIESPFEDAENYEQRIKRQRFYERNGMPMLDMIVEEHGDSFNVITSDPSFDISSVMEKVITTLNDTERVIASGKF